MVTPLCLRGRRIGLRRRERRRPVPPAHWAGRAPPRLRVPPPSRTGPGGCPQPRPSPVRAILRLRCRRRREPWCVAGWDDAAARGLRYERRGYAKACARRFARRNGDDRVRDHGPHGGLAGGTRSCGPPTLQNDCYIPVTWVPWPGYKRVALGLACRSLHPFPL